MRYPNPIDEAISNAINKQIQYQTRRHVWRKVRERRKNAKKEADYWEE